MRNEENSRILITHNNYIYPFYYFSNLYFKNLLFLGNNKLYFKNDKIRKKFIFIFYYISTSFLFIFIIK
jgi:hypothetical protein